MEENIVKRTVFSTSGEDVKEGDLAVIDHLDVIYILNSACYQANYGR
ncbi:MAG: hypothetical protein ACXAEU_15810 [Candidatus Hodarchaeales archaeon]